MVIEHNDGAYTKSISNHSHAPTAGLLAVLQVSANVRRIAAKDMFDAGSTVVKDAMRGVNLDGAHDRRPIVTNLVSGKVSRKPEVA